MHPNACLVASNNEFSFWSTWRIPNVIPQVEFRNTPRLISIQELLDIREFHIAKVLFVLKSIPRFPSQLEKLKTLLLAPSLRSLARNLLCGVAPLFASFLTLYMFMSALRFLACLETDRVYSVRSIFLNKERRQEVT